jgi:hypothetical protein
VSLLGDAQAPKLWSQRVYGDNLTVIMLTLTFLALTVGQPANVGAGPFQDRGYYITFVRMPTYDLAAWKHVVDGIHDDGGNLLVLWMGGAFRSKKFPVTWKYNDEHQNIREDFVRDLIDHAHTKGVRVLLGFTPFGYDGVNQFPLEHSELRAIGKDGKPAGKMGISSWGYNLCPAKPKSQEFMLDYVREMFFEFYPNADGLLIESSDYAICHCPECGPKFFEREFQFVRTISEEVWAKKPEAMIVVYPHYFSGAAVPGFGVRAAKQHFDPRWTLFFTPHSAPLDRPLIQQARHSLWWDDAPARRLPRDIQQGVLRARKAGVTGYVPSLEAFSFIATESEEGQAWLKGRRQVPFGFGWLKPSEPPYDELPIRVNRIAYREFCRNPDLDFEDFKTRLGQEFFGVSSSRQLVDDLLDVQTIFAVDRTWCQPSPVVCPDRVRAMKRQGKLSVEKQAEYSTALAKLRSIEQRHERPASERERQLLQIARWVHRSWGGENQALLNGQK